MIRMLLLLFLGLPCWGQDAVVELMSSRIPANAIFPGADPALDLGPAPAPAPGARRRVTRGQLIRWARHAGVDEAGLPDAVILERKLRSWPETEAEETIRGLLAETAGIEAGSLEVELQDYVAAEIPAGPLEWSLLGLPAALGEPVRLSLRWRDDGGRTGVESLTGVIRATARVLVAVTELPAGAEIAAPDFVLAEAELSNLRKSYLQRIESTKRWILIRDMRADDLLSEDLLERRPDVERGALVELIAAAGAVRLRAPGRAEGSGSIGDRIAFRNLATDRRVLARLADSKTAEVIAQ
jgi:flagella basal body P-ring formation protein FlgA